MTTSAVTRGRTSLGHLGRRALLALGTASALGLGLPLRPVMAAPAVPIGVVVTASSYGFDAEDSTDALQAALDSSADTVIIDNVGSPWITRPLFVRRSNLTLILANGVELLAKAGGFTGKNDCLLTVDGQQDVTISGYGATARMLKPEYATGEWRMTLSLLSVSRVTVAGLTLCDSGGDGVYLGVSVADTSAPHHCEDVVLRDLVIDNHRRNGISVISAKGLVIEGCLVSNTKGTNPQAGIDFEPNNSDQRLQDIVVRDCIFTNNWSCQAQLYTKRMATSSEPISITMQRVLFDGQAGGQPMVLVWADGEDDPSGVFAVHDSVINNTGSSGSVGVLYKSSETFRVSVARTVVWNWDTAARAYGPLHFTATRSDGSDPLPAYGGVDLDDLLMVTNQPLDVIVTRPYRPGEPQPDPMPRFTDVHGRLTVVSPEPMTADLGPNPDDVDLVVDNRLVEGTPNPFGAAVTIEPEVVTLGSQQQIVLSAQRREGIIDAPLGVAYVLSGTAVERHDIGGHSGVMVFPADKSTVSVSIPVVEAADRTRLVRTSVVASPWYTASPSGRRTAAIRPQG